MQIINFLEIKKQLPDQVNLLAVSKGFKAEDIERIYDLGQKHFGESKVQEAIRKKINLAHKNDIVWHFIGRIQSNKIKKIVENFDYVHSVDSVEKLIKISDASYEFDKELNLMIQVKFSEDPNKGGIETSQLIEAWNDIKHLRNINVKGLMTINPRGLDSIQNFNLFSQCRKLADSLQLRDCSMGMTQDWQQAVKAGSTWIRIGSLIFGDRLI